MENLVDIRIKVTKAEKRAIERAKGGDTHRVSYMTGLGLNPEPRKRGRPIMDQLEKDWADRAKAQRAEDAEALKQLLKVDGGARKALDSMYEKAQKRRVK